MLFVSMVSDNVSVPSVSNEVKLEFILKTEPTGQQASICDDNVHFQINNKLMGHCNLATEKGYPNEKPCFFNQKKSDNNKNIQFSRTV